MTQKPKFKKIVLILFYSGILFCSSCEKKNNLSKSILTFLLCCYDHLKNGEELSIRVCFSF